MRLLAYILLINLAWGLLAFIKPIIVLNRRIPFKGFSAITISPFVFCKEEMDSKTLTHEYKHILQQRICTPLGFFAFYLLQYLYHLIIVRHSPFNAYWYLSFERQAREFARTCTTDVKQAYNKKVVDLRRDK